MTAADEPPKRPISPDADPRDADPLDQAFAAYLRACDAGESGSREDFIRQFPELSDDLARLLDAVDMIGHYTRSSAEDDRHEATAAWHPDGVHLGEPGLGATEETVAFREAGTTDVNGTLPLSEEGAQPVLPFELGDYRLERVLGRGGMGVVYLALQRPLERQVAVKMIRSGLLAEGDEVRRFFAEARAAAKLRHPHIVAVYQFGELGGHHFFSMEYVPGTDLAQLIKAAPLDPRGAARYVRDVAQAIDYAHGHGVLHRDLKPANVLIDASDQVHISDFGLSKQMGVDSGLTASGVAVGTPAYMAPEQARGDSDQATQATDVYALGAILFACLAGRPPFQAKSVVQTLTAVVHQKAPRLTSLCPSAPEDLDTICAKCLEKSPKKRYRTAATLAKDLDRFLQGEPIKARPRARWQRTLHWVQGVPLVAAVTGRSVLDTTPAHRRFQAALLMLIVLLPFFVVAGLTAVRFHHQRMPSQITLAGGLDGGVYQEVSRALGRRLQEAAAVPVTVLSSSGSLDNRQRLLAGEIDLAPMQASAVTGTEIRVTAPLFYEAVHLLARKGSGVTTVDDLAGHEVAVGPEGSGSRLAAEFVFDSLGLPPEKLPRRVIPWPELTRVSGLEVTVVCVGRGSHLVARLLADDWRLVPLENAVEISLQHPTLRPMNIEASDFPSFPLPAAGIPTVGTTAYLAVREDTPDVLVRQTLEVLYQPPPLVRGMISRRNAAEWQGLSFHPAARAFFAETTETASP